MLWENTFLKAGGSKQIHHHQLQCTQKDKLTKYNWWVNETISNSFSRKPSL